MSCFFERQTQSFVFSFFVYFFKIKNSHRRNGSMQASFLHIPMSSLLKILAKIIFPCIKMTIIYSKLTLSNLLLKLLHWFKSIKMQSQKIWSAVPMLDNFPGSQKLPDPVPGCPNFRRVPGYKVYCCGQPTVQGFKVE